MLLERQAWLGAPQFSRSIGGRCSPSRNPRQTSKQRVSRAKLAHWTTSRRVVGEPLPGSQDSIYASTPIHCQSWSKLQDAEHGCLIIMTWKFRLLKRHKRLV